MECLYEGSYVLFCTIMNWLDLKNYIPSSRWEQFDLLIETDDNLVIPINGINSRNFPKTNLWKSRDEDYISHWQRVGLTVFDFKFLHGHRPEYDKVFKITRRYYHCSITLLVKMDEFWIQERDLVGDYMVNEDRVIKSVNCGRAKLILVDVVSRTF